MRDLSRQEESLVNSAVLCGLIDTDLVELETKFSEKIYEFSVRVERISGVVDIIPCRVSERCYGIEKLVKGHRIKVAGRYSSYNNRYDDSKPRLILGVFVTRIEDYTSENDYNYLRVEGYLCKKHDCRYTASGRDICDLILAVNRTNNKRTDYIPSIIWGNNAHYLSDKVDIGTKISAVGRIQSREYIKKFEGKEETRVAYEFSINSFDILELPKQKEIDTQENNNPTEGDE